ncbi:MAG: DUF2309 domain-containing protein, partial [Gammaproteobacteria bacterium]|nr:DUF2309 domain-containing protein [Gammaproteobacteria bacterium]
LHSFQSDVAQSNREKLLSRADQTEAEAIQALWATCLEKLNLQHFVMHPEDMVDLDPERAEEFMGNPDSAEEPAEAEMSSIHRQVRKDARNISGQLMRDVGHHITLRGLLLTLTGIDILDDIASDLQRHIANYLDQGLSAWHSADRSQGFYAAWKNSALHDLSWVFDQLPEWPNNIRELPDNALDSIVVSLTRLGLPQTHWGHYLERLALELPGWSGMFLWRQMNPGYDDSNYPVNILDYLAVRLILEQLYGQRLCREQWQIEANFDVLRWYFRRRRSEFYVRHMMFNQRLPEYLLSQAQRQLQNSLNNHSDYLPWKGIADMILIWLSSPMGSHRSGYNVFQHGWQLFRIAQHNGLSADDISALSKEQVASIFQCIESLDDEKHGFLWLQAYERNYREKLFNALANNQGRGRWRHRSQRPNAQVVFCMDDREEAIRRHLEELNPMLETMGAAGFFGVPINWKGLDDDKITGLCPVVITPSHELRELADTGEEQRQLKHQRRRSLRLRLKSLIHQETHRSLFTPLLIAAAAPVSLLALISKIFGFRLFGQSMEAWRDRFDIQLKTRIALTADDDGHQPSPEHPRLGFTDTEQADRIQTFLRNIGLTQGFGQFVVMMGHGSMSQNNPHLAAYDCGACSGNHGGPNARIFAQIANRVEIRSLLKQRGINIPDDTCFLGAEHNTCDETILWYDTDQVPPALLDNFKQLKDELFEASRKSAHERCRRLASAPRRPSLQRALKHIIGRGYDFSQARPELGHATNAAAFIGRRSMSQGAFFDRRVFLISYDPTQDNEEGHIIETLLLANGPVGAGINLEYYFSTVNNAEYGSGSKVTHNVTGLFAVMDGSSSDLRTGLPLQMVEIHEAMRLQVVVEASTEILTKIYLRQPPLQELVGNGWLLLSAQDPDTGDISVFIPDKGFVPWQGPVSELPTVGSSTDWYKGQQQPLDPALIKQEARLA